MIFEILIFIILFTIILFYINKNYFVTKKSLAKVIEEKNRELLENNNKLESIVFEKIEELRQKDKMLFQQSKNSAMGEMISLIAHQWRQPLNELSIIIQQSKIKYDKKALNKELMNEYTNKSLSLINKMSDTIDDFRYFLEPQKEKNYLNLLSCVNKTVELIDILFKRHNITLTIDINSDITILGYENEFSQVLLNLINNSKDAFLANNIENPEIKIEAKKINKEKIEMSFWDNAGGIPMEIIHDIFNPYFTTKFASQGTGLGLYMTKLIIEDNMNGKIFVKNHNNGTQFFIVFDIVNLK